MERRQLAGGGAALRAGARVDDARGAAFLLGLAVPAALAAANGAYFPSEWGLAALGFLAVAATALIVRDRVDAGRLDVAFPAALALFGGWVALSAWWAPSAAAPVLEAERMLVYVAAALAFALALSRRSAGAALAGAAAGISGVAAYALAVREGGQLAEPIGYWNALGILLALGLLLAAGVAVHGRPAAAGLLPVLAAGLSLTFSRGSWGALALGLAVLLALDPARFRLLLLLPAPALGLAAAQAAGWRLAAALAGATLAALALGRVAARFQPGPRLRRGLAGAAVALALAGFAATLVRVGSPLDEFRAPLPAGEGDLSGRLASLSGNGRADYWRVAWRAVEDEPLLGVGGGGYERRWVRERPTSFAARDAHNLYLETLAELGPVGLVLLVLALGVPLAALARARRQALAPAAGAAYLAFLAHAALDWDWEVPAVAATGLLCGAVLVTLARGGGGIPLTPRRRAHGLAALVPLLALAAVMHAGNRALSASAEALDRAEAASAAAQARRARTWMPWSHEPLQLLGRARLAAGRPEEARATLRAALARDPGDWSVWYDLAVASEGPARERALARATRLNPLSPEIADLKE